MEGVECKVPSTSAYNMTVAYLSYHRQHSYLWAIKLCESSAIPDVHIHYPYMDIWKELAENLQCKFWLNLFEEISK